MRGIEDLHSSNYPDFTPLAARPVWRAAKGRPGTSAATVSSQCLEPFGTDIGILNPLFPVQSLFSDDLAEAYTSALNDWTRGEFLDKDARFRASIVITLENIEMAVAEIDRCAADRRFVQVMVLSGTARPLGQRMLVIAIGYVQTHRKFRRYHIWHKVFDVDWHRMISAAAKPVFIAKTSPLIGLTV